MNAFNFKLHFKKVIQLLLVSKSYQASKQVYFAEL